jgi:hypothetical protein
MNYYIAFISENGTDWAVLESTDYDYINRVYEEICAPPGYNTELRATEEDIDTHLSYEVLRYDHSEF